MKTGLYIGRFQPFHYGHKLIVDTMLKEVDIVVICIGISEGEDKNPYDYTTRLHFFTHIYSNTHNIYFYPLQDTESDEDWVQNILEIPQINESTEIYLYHGDTLHDSAVQVMESHKKLLFPRSLTLKEISRTILPYSGTEIRNEMLQVGIETLSKKIPPEVSEIIKKGNAKLDF